MVLAFFADAAVFQRWWVKSTFCGGCCHVGGNRRLPSSARRSALEAVITAALIGEAFVRRRCPQTLESSMHVLVLGVPAPKGQGQGGLSDIGALFVFNSLLSVKQPLCIFVFGLDQKLATKWLYN